MTKTGNLSEVSRKYGVGVNVLSKWRQSLLERGYRVFENGPDQENQHLRKQVGKLEQMVGKKEVELNLLIRSDISRPLQAITSDITERQANATCACIRTYLDNWFTVFL